MPEPVKVLFLDHIAELSGGEIALDQLLRHLDRDAFTPVVALAADGPFATRLREQGIDVRVIPLSPAARHRGRDAGVRDLADPGVGRELLAYSRRLAAWIRGENFALIHTNSLKADLYGGLAGRLAKVPVVWHLRDRIDRSYLSPALHLAMRLGLRLLPAHVICNSAATSESIAGMSRVPRTVIPSGVPLGPPPVPPPGGRALVVGMLARISVWKGQQVFVAAAASLAAADPPIRFQIAGAAMFEVDRAYEAETRALAARLGLADRIEFLGFVDDTRTLLDGFDILVHASTLPEPLGKAILEAMAAGRPVVATDLGGAREVMVDGETGLLIPPADPDALADAIRVLLADPGRRAAMGLAGRRRVEERYDARATTRLVEEVLRGVLGSRAARAARVTA